jgi:hypothetical protein
LATKHSTANVRLPREDGQWLTKQTEWACVTIPQLHSILHYRKILNLCQLVLY